MTEPETKPATLEIAVYGLVNAGKSSLINALAGIETRPVSPIGGTTTEVVDVDWTVIPADFDAFDLHLLDTPGLEEIDDAGKSVVSEAAARRADLVLFVIAEDLTDSAFEALRSLRTVGKPILVALNKIDLFSNEERAIVLEAVRRRLIGIVAAEDVIPIAAAPIVRERITDERGTRVVAHRGAPEIDVLLERLQRAVRESGRDLKDLNGARLQVETLAVDREREKAERRVKAERVADETSVGLALALAVNPIPLIDFLTGPGGLAILVARVSAVYGDRLTTESARSLAKELLRGGRVVLWGSVATVLAGGAMKLLPGVGHLAGALAQGSAAGYLAHVLGRALIDYLENGHDWGDGGIVAVLDRIAASADRKTITQGIVDQLRSRLHSR